MDQDVRVSRVAGCPGALDRLSHLGLTDAPRLVDQIAEAGGSIAALDLGRDPMTPSPTASSLT